MIPDKIKTALRRAVADTCYSTKAYMLWKLSVCKDDRPVLRDLFTKLQNTEFNKHMSDLIEWCETYDCEIPRTDSEMKRSAGAAMTKIIDSIKKDQTADFYFDEAIRLETYMLL